MGMKIKDINMLVLDYIGTTPDGYLCHFNYNTHDSFYHDYCDLEVDVAAVRARGLSTRKAFIEILKQASPRDQAKIIRGTFDYLKPPINPTDDRDHRRKTAHEALLLVAQNLEAGGHVETPVLEQTSEVVAEALKDAEILLEKSGPKNAVDRAHTALHGYLNKLCRDRGETLPNNASLTDAFKIIREKFPEFAQTIAHDYEAKRLFGSLSQSLDSLNTIRNRATLAHPNDLLLHPAEAMLYINLSRAVLGYLEARTKPKPPPAPPMAKPPANWPTF